MLESIPVSNEKFVITISMGLGGYFINIICCDIKSFLALYIVDLSPFSILLFFAYDHHPHIPQIGIKTITSIPPKKIVEAHPFTCKL